MTKPKTWDLEPSLDADWPPQQPMTIEDLVAEARAAEWDFTGWCYASGYDASRDCPNCAPSTMLKTLIIATGGQSPPWPGRSMQRGAALASRVSQQAVEEEEAGIRAAADVPHRAAIAAT